MKKTPVLMSAENPDGWTLEALLAQLIDEVKAKDAKLVGDSTELAQDVHFNNICILHSFENALRLQRRSFEKLDAAKPDEGPTGKPRIGGGAANV